MITTAMKIQLSELGYSSQDIASLSPERAAAIIDNGIRCPSGGVPSNWKRSVSSKSAGVLSQVFGAVTRLVAFGLVSAVSLHFSGMDLGIVSDHVDRIARVLLDSTNTHAR